MSAPATTPAPQDPPTLTELNARLVGIVSSLLVAAACLEQAISLTDRARSQVSRARLQAAGLLARLPIPTTEGDPT